MTVRNGKSKIVKNLTYITKGWEQAGQGQVGIELKAVSSFRIIGAKSDLWSGVF